MSQGVTRLIYRPAGMDAWELGPTTNPRTVALLKNVTIRKGVAEIRPGMTKLGTAHGSGSDAIQGIGRVKLGANKRLIKIIKGQCYYWDGSAWQTTNMPSSSQLSTTEAAVKLIQNGDYAIVTDGTNDPTAFDGTNLSKLTPKGAPAAIAYRTYQSLLVADDFNQVNGAAHNYTQAVNATAWLLIATDDAGATWDLIAVSATSFKLKKNPAADQTSIFKIGSQIRFTDADQSDAESVMVLKSITWNAGTGENTLTVKVVSGAALPATMDSGDKLYTRTSELFTWEDNATAPGGSTKHSTKIVLKNTAAMNDTETVDLVVAVAFSTYPISDKVRSVALLVYAPNLFSDQNQLLKLRVTYGPSPAYATTTADSVAHRVVPDPAYPYWFWVVFDFDPVIPFEGSAYAGVSKVSLVATGGTPPATDSYSLIHKIMFLGNAPYNVLHGGTQTKFRTKPYAFESPLAVLSNPVAVTPAYARLWSFPLDEDAGHYYVVRFSDPSDSDVDRRTLYRLSETDFFQVGTADGTGAKDVVDNLAMITSSLRAPSVYASTIPRCKHLGKWRTRLVAMNVQVFKYETGSGYDTYPARIYVSAPQAENNTRLMFNRRNPSDAMFDKTDAGFYLSLEPDAGSEILGGVELGELGSSAFIIFTEKGVYRMTGWDARDVRIQNIGHHGLQSPASIAIRDQVIYYLATDDFVRRIGIAGGWDQTPVGDPIQPWITACSKSSRQNAAGFITKDGYYMLALDVGSGVYEAACYDILRGAWMIQACPARYAAVQDLAGDDMETYVLGADFFVRQYWAGTQDDGVDITGTIQTHIQDSGADSEKTLRNVTLTGTPSAAGRVFAVTAYAESGLTGATENITLKAPDTAGKTVVTDSCTFHAEQSLRGAGHKIKVVWTGPAGTALYRALGTVQRIGELWKTTS